MPLLKLETNAPIQEETRKALLASLSRILTETLGKPEQYVMVSVSHSEVVMSGQEGFGALVEVRSIGGLSGEAPRALSQKICAALKETLGIVGSRVYLNFMDVEGTNWGWNGDTFG